MSSGFGPTDVPFVDVSTASFGDDINVTVFGATDTFDGECVGGDVVAVPCNGNELPFVLLLLAAVFGPLQGT